MYCTEGNEGTCFVDQDVMKAVDYLTDNNPEYPRLRSDFLACICSQCPVSCGDGAPK